MESHYFHLILNYLHTHPHAGELFTFLVAFFESLPMIGAVIPGSVTMTIVGILIGTGVLPGVWTLCIASAATFCGDCIGFFLGRYYNERLRNMWPFRRYPYWLEIGESFFKKHGGKSIILGRFTGPARCMVPMIGGLLRLTWLRFSVAAIPSAVMWAILYTGPGILLGALSREMPKGETTRFLLYGIGIIVAIWLIVWLIQHFFIQLGRGINYITDQCWQYLAKKNSGNFFIRLIQNQQKPSDHHQLTLFFGAIIFSILFLILFINVRMQGVLTKINYPIFHLLQTIRTPLWNKIFVAITIMGAPNTILFITLVSVIGLWIKKQRYAAVHMFIGFALISSLTVIFKSLSHSLRPQLFNIVASSFSFPSGHTALSTTMFMLIAFIISKSLNKNNRWIPYGCFGIFILTIAFSRLYLGAHWFTDIIGSFLLGLLVFHLCIISYRRMPHIKYTFKLSRQNTLILFGVSLSVAWTTSIIGNYEKILYNTTPLSITKQITINAWWKTPLQYTPLYRNNRLGRPFQPFNVQWQGSLETIIDTLKKHDWKTVEKKSELKATLQRLAQFQAQYHLPVLPWLYHNRIPDVFLIKKIPNSKRIIELRLWESDIRFSKNKLLWIGTANIRIPPKELLSLKERARISLKNGGGLDELSKNTNQFTQKFITVTNQKPQHIQALHWNNKILLIRED